MHILLIADGRSPTTCSYIEMLQTSGFTISLASTFPCRPIKGLNAQETLPVALGGFSRRQTAVGGGRQSPRQGGSTLLQKIRLSLYPLRYTLGPLSIHFYMRRYLNFLDRIKPDIVHALRIPFEGMLAAHTPVSIPLVVSIWGNDLTLHGQASGMMRTASIRTLQRADGLAADTQRDIRLGRAWGFAPDKPTLVIPGSGGLQLEKIDQHRPEALASLPERLRSVETLVFNPRGIRPGSVRTDTFFQSIPQVLEHIPGVLFACSAMQDQPEAIEWVQRLGIQENVILLPRLPQETMWELFRLAKVSVSVSQHDGTPNSLLEAMACGCFPIAGDIEPLREWIAAGENGLLVDPCDPPALASALLEALQDLKLRQQAALRNRTIVETRATQAVTAEKTRAFYSLF